MRGAWVLACLLVLPVLASASGGAAPTDAPAWWQETLLDLDRDGLDDALPTTGGPPLRVLVDYAAMPTGEQLAALEARGARIATAYAHFPIVAVDAAPALLPFLRAAPGVVLIERNDDIHPLLKESVPLVGAPLAWQKYKVTGKGVTVAVLDDGAFEQHPSLRDRLAGDYDAGTPSTPFGAPIGVVGPAGEEGHGTHVAGTVVGSGLDAQGGQTGFRGVAPEARYANVKVFTAPNQTKSDVVLRGLDWVISNAKELDIRVVSMSLGGSPSDGRDALSRAVDIAVDKGLVVVAAAGNAGPGSKTITAPGAAQKAITVGAVDKQKRIAPYSSRGPTLGGLPKPDLVAPGTSIVSAVPPSTTSMNGLRGGSAQVLYGSLSGTSMATPHVSGIVALMLQANPSLTPIEVKRMLLVTAQDVGRAGVENETGYGFVNGIAAVQVASDPGILDSPEFRAKLAAIPDPPPEPWLQKLEYQAEALVRSGLLPLYGAMLAGVLAVGIFAYVAVRRIRR